MSSTSSCGLDVPAQAAVRRAGTRPFPSYPMVAGLTGATRPPRDQQVTDSQEARDLTSGDATTVAAGGRQAGHPRTHPQRYAPCWGCHADARYGVTTAGIRPL